MATDNGKGIVTVTKGDRLGDIASKYLSTYGKQCGCTKVWGSGGYVEYLGKLMPINTSFSSIRIICSNISLALVVLRTTTFPRIIFK